MIGSVILYFLFDCGESFFIFRLLHMIFNSFARCFLFECNLDFIALLESSSPPLIFLSVHELLNDLFH